MFFLPFEITANLPNLEIEFQVFDSELRMVNFKNEFSEVFNYSFESIIQFKDVLRVERYYLHQAPSPPPKKKI